jgi:hypothetical protein
MVHVQIWTEIEFLRWFKDVCESPAIKIFHNAMYDVSWIRNLGIKINGFNYRYHGCSIID